MPPAPAARHRTRRAVLGAVGTGGLAALAGCTGGSGEPSPAPTETSTASPAATASPTASPGTGLADQAAPDRFDFWAGRWSRQDGGGVTVYPLLGGHLLLDAYGPVDDPSALAMTFFDPAGEASVRRFLDRRGTLVRLRGGLDGDAMVLRGERIGADGSMVPMRATFEPVPDGAVHHTLERGDEDNADWTTTFDATYDRDGDAPDYPTPTAAAVPDSATALADRPPRRQFDFWVGEWAVFNGDRQVGESVIPRRLDGHLVLEHWFGRGGGTGMSFNYFDPAADAWTQNWVSGNGTWIEMRGGIADGAMRMVGVQVSAFGSTVDYRGTFTPLADGTVEQVLETSSDGGDTWNVAFAGRYRPSS